MTLLFLVMSLGVYRVTRLVTLDEFPPAAAARGWVVAHGPRWLGYLVRCPWCTSPWVAAGIVGAVDPYAPLPWPVLWVPAVAAVAGMLAMVVLLIEALVDLTKALTPQKAGRQDG